MNSRVLFIIIALITAFAVLFCVTRMERVPFEKHISPSREAASNPHLALERWMSAAGLAYRFLDAGDISLLLAAPEKTVFIQTSSFDWIGDGENNAPELKRWIKDGGHLVLSVDARNWGLNALLEEFGIEGYSGSAEPEPENEPENPYSLHWEEGFRVVEQKEGVEDIAVLWKYGGIRLVTLSLGEGSFTVMGQPRFLEFFALKNRDNADLTWDLLFKQGKAGGILFFWGLEPDQHFFGALFDQGNPLAFFTAALLLTIAGFWMVIPLFGRNKPVRKLPGKALGERFLAEGRFMKKYGALDTYLEIYRQELGYSGLLAGEVSSRAGSPGGKPRHPLDIRQFMELQKKFIAHWMENL
ncbi:MAG: hypothetical protein LBK74_03950 [Treponema sp.]|nr:hypothetical protein [Treponema sp.]